MIKRYWIRFSAAFLLVMLWPSQVGAEHLFEAGLRAGVAGYDAQCRYVQPAPGLNAGLQLAYAYHSPRVIGFRIGATMDCHQAGFKKTDYSDTYTVIDVDDDAMQVDYSIASLREKYSTWALGVPVQLALGKKHFALYIGPKFVFPLRSRWTETAENAELSVYYPMYENRVYESYPLAASRDFQLSQSATVAKSALPKIQYWLAAELNYDIPVYTGTRIKSYISVGIYFDYSLYSAAAEPSDRISLVMLTDTRDGFPLHRLMTPVVSAFRQNRRLVSSRNPFDLGVKIAYRIAPYNPHLQSLKTCHCL